MSQCRKFAVLWTFTVVALSIASFAIYRKFLAPDTNSGGTSEKLSADWTGSNALNESARANPWINSTSRPKNILTSSTETVQTLSNQSPGGVSYVQDVTGGEESTTRANRSEKTCRTATASTPDLALNAPEIFHVVFNVLVNVFGVPLTNNYTRDSSVLNPVVNDSDLPISNSNEKSRPDFRVETLETRTGSENEFDHEHRKSDPSHINPSDFLNESTPNLVNESRNRTSQFSIKDQRNEFELEFSTKNVMLVNNTSQMKVSEPPTTDGYSRTVEIREDRVPENSRLNSRNTFDGSKIDSVHRSSSTHTPSISSYSRNTINYGSFPVTGSYPSLESHPKVENSDNILYPIHKSRVSSPSVQRTHSTGTSHSVSSGYGPSIAATEENIGSEAKFNLSPTYTSTKVLQSTTHHDNLLITTAKILAHFSTRSSQSTSPAETLPENPVVTTAKMTMRYLHKEASLSSLQNNHSALVNVYMTTSHSRFSTDNLPSSDVNENSSPKDNISDHKVNDDSVKLSRPFSRASKPVVTISSRTDPYFAPIKITAGHTETDASVTMRSPSVNNPFANPTYYYSVGSIVLIGDPTPVTYLRTNAPSTLFQTSIIDHSTIRSNEVYSYLYSSSTPYVNKPESTKVASTVSSEPMRPHTPVFTNTTTSTTTESTTPEYENDGDSTQQENTDDTDNYILVDGKNG